MGEKIEEIRRRDHQEKNPQFFSFSLPGEKTTGPDFGMKPELLFHVESGKAPQRLDVFLSQREKILSRSQIKRLIEQGQVKVGGKKAKAGLRLKTGDEVSLILPEPQEPEVRAGAPSPDHPL